jgi:hypothetical protein
VLRSANVFWRKLRGEADSDDDSDELTNYASEDEEVRQCVIILLT